MEAKGEKDLYPDSVYPETRKKRPCTLYEGEHKGNKSSSASSEKQEGPRVPPGEDLKGGLQGLNGLQSLWSGSIEISERVLGVFWGQSRSQGCEAPQEEARWSLGEKSWEGFKRQWLSGCPT